MEKKLHKPCKMKIHNRETARMWTDEALSLVEALYVDSLSEFQAIRRELEGAGIAEYWQMDDAARALEKLHQRLEMATS